MKQFDLLHVMAGYRCNLKCNHCVNDSGPERSDEMSSTEIHLLANDIAKYTPKHLLFTGGEPTLYINTINYLIQSHPRISDVNVTITSNGWFSKSQNLMTKTLSKFCKLDHLQLSFDTFHGSRLNSADVKRLEAFCANRNIGFNISMCISSPIELIQANELQNTVGCKITFQKVEASGRGKTHGTAFKYQAFDESVLTKKCPNLGSINYIANVGYTSCCSNLVFNKGPSRMKVADQSIEKYMESDFNKAINNFTFGELIKNFGLKGSLLPQINPSMSSPCTLCENIFCGGQ